MIIQEVNIRKGGFLLEMEIRKGGVYIQEAYYDTNLLKNTC